MIKMTLEQFIDLVYGGAFWLIVGTLILIALYSIYSGMSKE